MSKVFDFIHLRKYGRMIGIVFITLALLVEVLEFIFDTLENGFFFENLFVLAFELLTCSFIIFSLLQKNIKLLEVAIVVLKTFEGTYYPLRSSQRLDILIHDPAATTFDIVNHIFFACSAFFMIIALLMFCIYKLNGHLVFWNVMKLLIFIASILMLANTILFVIELKNTKEWFEIFEPISLMMMFFGVYGTCEFIEGELHREKKANIA